MPWRCVHHWDDFHHVYPDATRAAQSMKNHSCKMGKFINVVLNTCIIMYLDFIRYDITINSSNNNNKNNDSNNNNNSNNNKNKNNNNDNDNSKKSSNNNNYNNNSSNNNNKNSCNCSSKKITTTRKTTTATTTTRRLATRETTTTTPTETQLSMLNIYRRWGQPWTDDKTWMIKKFRGNPFQ